MACNFVNFCVCWNNFRGSCEKVDLLSSTFLNTVVLWLLILQNVFEENLLINKILKAALLLLPVYVENLPVSNA